MEQPGWMFPGILCCGCLKGAAALRDLVLQKFLPRERVSSTQGAAQLLSGGLAAMSPQPGFPLQQPGLPC